MKHKDIVTIIISMNLGAEMDLKKELYVAFGLFPNSFKDLH